MIAKTEKTFDCIDFKRQAQARIYEEIKDMTDDEVIAYFRKSVESGPMADFWKRISAHRLNAPEHDRQ